MFDPELYVWAEDDRREAAYQRQQALDADRDTLQIGDRVKLLCCIHQPETDDFDAFYLPAGTEGTLSGKTKVEDVWLVEVGGWIGEVAAATDDLERMRD